MLPDNKHFLIVDDDADDRFFFIRALSKVNPAYHCSIAKNGVDAIEKLKDMQPLPDYIFLDFNMPKMNGLDCLGILKSDLALHHIPVIIYSTSVYSKDIEKAKACGAAHYLPKPLDIQLLPELIVEAMHIADQPTS
jgi:CheY-like chemotaxis protein